MSNETVRRRLADLRRHELQPSLLADMPADYLDGVERDLRANGLTTPVEILPDNTVIADWHLVLAAQHLEWQDIPVRVRHDLAEQGEAAIQHYLVVAHLRWLRPSPLGLAQVYQRLTDWADQLPRPRLGIYGGRRPKTVIAEWVGLSRRNLSRYLRVLRTPTVVQNAFQAGALSLDQAEQVGGLSRDAQDGIAARIRGGDDPAEAVRSSLPQKDGKHRKLRYALKAFLRNLHRGLTDLEDRADQISRLHTNDIAVLEQARALIGQLIQQAAAPDDSGGDTAQNTAPDSDD